MEVANKFNANLNTSQVTSPIRKFSRILTPLKFEILSSSRSLPSTIKLSGNFIDRIQSRDEPLHLRIGLGIFIIRWPITYPCSSLCCDGLHRLRFHSGGLQQRESFNDGHTFGLPELSL